MNEYIFINVRVSSGVYAVLYRHGDKYAVTDYSNGSSGVTTEFSTRAQAVSFRENLRGKK